MAKVDFGSGRDEQECLESIRHDESESTKVTMYPPAPVHTLTMEEFAGRLPAAFAYLSKRSFTNDEMNTLLAWMEEDQADGDAAMERFLKNYEVRWTPGLDADTAAKVEDAPAKLETGAGSTERNALLPPEPARPWV